MGLNPCNNDTVGSLSRTAQQRRIDNGELDTQWRLPIGEQHLYVGDEIVTRRNQRRLDTDRHHMVRNRDQWTITILHRNGDITATGATGTVRLPVDYVAAHVELGYAQTSHAAQGRTVDRSILVLDQPTDVRGVYVPLTRGRHHNDAYITTTGEHTALDVFADAITRSWIDQPAIARQAELARTHRPRPGTLDAAALRTLLDQQAQISEFLGQLQKDLQVLPRLVDSERGRLASATAERDRDATKLAAAEATVAALDRPLLRRRHRDEIIDAERDIQALPIDIAHHNHAIDRHTEALASLEPRLADAQHRDKRRPRLQNRLRDIDDRLGDDRRIRARQLRRNPPQRITDTIGTRPKKGDRIGAWDTAAGYLDQHQTAHNITTGLGPTRGRGITRAFRHSRALAATHTEETEHQRNLEQAITRNRVMRRGR